MVKSTKLNNGITLTDAQNIARGVAVKYSQYEMTLEMLTEQKAKLEKKLANEKDEVKKEALKADIAKCDEDAKKAEAILDEAREVHEKVKKAMVDGGSNEEAVENFLRVLAVADNKKLSKYALRDFVTESLYEELVFIHSLDADIDENGALRSTKAMKEAHARATAHLEQIFREGLSIKASAYFPQLNIKLNAKYLRALHECFVIGCKAEFGENKDGEAEYKGFKLTYAASVTNKKGADGVKERVFKAQKLNDVCVKIALARIYE